VAFGHLDRGWEVVFFGVVLSLPHG
jgi:hypothetical protein